MTASIRMMKLIWRGMLVAIALYVSNFGFATNALTAPLEYEIEGIITQTNDSPDFVIKMKAQFKVYVRGTRWLIQTTEDKLITGERGYKKTELVKREIGSLNGSEIVDLETPLQGGITSLTIASNDVPFGSLESAVVGHLWLMLASGSYLSTLKTNLLTPVYEPMLPDNRKKQRAEWDLTDGPGSLPREVRYVQDNGRLLVIYSITGVTNVNGAVFPTEFVFNGGRKKATATITALRPVCTLSSLLPSLAGETLVLDRRLARVDRPVQTTYRLSPGAGFPSVAEAKKLFEKKMAKRNPPKTPKKSPLALVLLGIVLLSPLGVGAIRVYTRRRRMVAQHHH